MRNLLLLRSTLLLVLASSGALGQGREPNERNIYLSEHPSKEAPDVYVVGGILTALRLEQPCDPARTKMLGWEGRFEPVVCAGKSVLLFPLHDLEPEDRFMLLVTLADGTELPFTVTSRQESPDDRTGDQQVNVFRDREAPAAVLASLYDSLGRERKLRDENEHLKQARERQRKEDASADHALAALLVNGARTQTPFVRRQKWTDRDGDTDMVVEVYSGKKKAAVVFEVTNVNPNNPWRVKEVHLSPTRPGVEPGSLFKEEAKPFALRMDRDEIPPGASGRIAVVVDKSAFTSKDGPADLALELFRQDGLLNALLVLDQRLARE